MPPHPEVTLVGRADQLGVLDSAVRRAREGSPSVLVLSGETGVGKTRLLRETAERQAVTLMYGGCVPVAGDPLPFAPLTQALRQLQAQGRVNLQLGRLPELARLLPDAPATPTTAETGGRAEPSLANASQLALFQSVLTLVDRLGAAAPVLFVVEDVQWADRSTLDLVRYLATNLTHERVVLAVTYRPEDVPAAGPVAGWVAELARLSVTERLPVERLSPSETVTLVGLLVTLGAGQDAVPDAATELRKAPDADLLARTSARSAGNPLFAEQLVLYGGLDPDAPLPATLRELLTARVSALPDATRRVVTAAAVLGRPVDLEVLSRTLGASVEQTEDDLVPALTANVVQVGADGSVGLRHPAFAEAVYDGILPTRRARLHRGAAEALEWYQASGTVDAGGGRGEISGELARHWLGAGDQGRALEASIEAGFAAERMFAFADAEASFRRAVDLMDQVPGTDHDPVRLLKHAAQDASLIGESPSATRLLERALGLADDDATRASLSARLGLVHYRAGHRVDAEERFRQALALLPDGEDSVLVARILAGLALLGAAWSRLEDADAACQRGLDVARRVGARREEGLLLNARGVAASARGQNQEAVGYLRAALAIARESGNPNDLATAHVNLSHVLGEAGCVDEAVEEWREAVDELTRVGLARQSGSLVTANVGGALLLAGRLDEADALLTEALSRHPRGITAAPVLMRAGQLAMIRGELEDAWELVEQARIVVEAENAPVAWLREVVEGAAEIELWAGRPEAAYELVIDGLHLVRDTDEEDRTGVLVGLGLRALANQAETKRDSSSRARLLALAAPLEDARGTATLTGPDAEALDSWHDAETARLSRRSDPEVWSACASRWAGLGRPFHEAYATWREAEARLVARTDADGIAALRRAYALATGLGATRLVTELANLATWHRVDLLVPRVPDEASRTSGGGADPGDAGLADAASSYGLTPRELEVLQGLADGRTNQEIADHLFISAKTASVHVSNILRKLDVSGRQEAARVAHRLGLGG